jgi:Flp pilus assembly pilin Flp
MAALIALVVIAGATILGDNTNATFEQVGAAIPVQVLNLVYS